MICPRCKKRIFSYVDKLSMREAGVCSLCEMHRSVNKNDLPEEAKDTDCITGFSFKKDMEEIDKLRYKATYGKEGDENG